MPIIFRTVSHFIIAHDLICQCTNLCQCTLEQSLAGCDVGFRRAPDRSGFVPTNNHRVSTWSRVPIHAVSCGYNPIRSNQRATTNMLPINTKRDLPRPRMRGSMLSIHHTTTEWLITTGCKKLKNLQSLFV